LKLINDFRILNQKRLLNLDYKPLLIQPISEIPDGDKMKIDVETFKERNFTVYQITDILNFLFSKRKTLSLSVENYTTFG